jgi:hypothetical protein
VISQDTRAWELALDQAIQEKLQRLQRPFVDLRLFRLVEHPKFGYFLAPLKPLRVVAEYELPFPPAPVPAVWVRPSGARLLDRVACGAEEAAFISEDELFAAALEVCQRLYRHDLADARRFVERICILVGLRKGVRLNIAGLPNVDSDGLQRVLAEMEAAEQARLAGRAPEARAPKRPAKRRTATRAASAEAEAAIEEMQERRESSSAFRTTDPNARPSLR